MPSAADAEKATAGTAVEDEVDESADTVVDEARQSLLEAVNAELGDAVVGQHLRPGRDVWVRVATEAWSETADYLRNRQRFRFFNYLSAIDWMPSPYGRSLDAAVDVEATADQAADGDAGDDGPEDDETEAAGPEKLAGGDTRFQVMARVYSLATGIGLHVKADVDDDDLAVGTWTEVYPGANWHEREVHEMFGIRFVGNPDMRNLYLPGDFEGHPLRKDYPLMARLIKPWPGIVDVEPMPDVPAADEAAPAGASTANPEDGS